MGRMVLCSTGSSYAPHDSSTTTNNSIVDGSVVNFDYISKVYYIVSNNF
jgi:hypothetical protein